MRKSILVPAVAAIGASLVSGCTVYPGRYAGPAVVVHPAPVVAVEGGEGGEGGHHRHKMVYPPPVIIFD